MVRRSSHRRTTTYRASGVNLPQRAVALRALVRAARYRAPISHGRPISAPGHYAGLLAIGQETLAVTTDTVGTKVLLAEELGRWEGVGEDVVTVNVNDLASVGARPAGIVDTILYGTASTSIFGALGRGIRRGLAHAECSLLGGETAQVPEIVRGIDLGGTAIGFFPRGRSPILGAAVRAGDTIVGLPSRGFHANGFTLVRRILKEHRVALRARRPGRASSIGRELLTPTRSYAAATEAISALPGVHGLAHISGGGFRNLSRLNGRRRFVLDRLPAVPDLFAWLQRLGGLEDQEMYGTFNMGIGFAIVASPRSRRGVLRALARAGFPDAREIGHVSNGAGVSLPQLGLDFSGYE